MTIHDDIANESATRHIHLPGYSVADAAALAALSSMVAGDIAYQVDTGDMYVYDGSAWNMFGYDEDWVNYSTTSTITGWAAGGLQKSIHYKKIANMVFVNFIITGTSNDTVATFTLPDDVYDAGTPGVNGVKIVAEDNGSGVDTAYCEITSGDPNLVACYKASGAAWTNSGTKLVAGQLFYWTD